MKLTWSTDWGARIEAGNPDDRMRDHMKEQFRLAWLHEAEAFAEEVSVALRKCKPGETVHLKSKPIEVTIEREKKKRNEKSRS